MLGCNEVVNGHYNSKTQLQMTLFSYCNAMFLAFPKLVMCYLVSKIATSWSSCWCGPFFQALVVILKNLKIGWCIHGSKLKLLMFSCMQLLLSWLLPSDVSFLLSSLLLLHFYMNLMFFYNSWLLHSYCNTFPTQHLSFCLYFSLPLL